MGASLKRKVALVEISTRSRRPLMASPRMRSDLPAEYTSAVSNMLTPASRQMSIRRRACATSVLPQALNSGPLPPKVPVPKLSTGTVMPDAPRRRYSMMCS